MKSHHFGSAEARHLNASTVMAVEMKAVEGSQQPQIDTRDPHQHRVLETLGKVWVGRVPRTVPVLNQSTKKTDSNDLNSHQNKIVGEHIHQGVGASASQGLLAS